MLWLGLLLLTVGAVAAVVVPLLRGRSGPAPSRGAFDRAVYRDQLDEIARDLERGTLDVEQANAARLEIERRLLATDAVDEAITRVPVPRRHRRRARRLGCHRCDGPLSHARLASPRG